MNAITVPGRAGDLAVDPDRLWVTPAALAAWAAAGNAGGRETLLASLAWLDSWRPNAGAARCKASALGLWFLLALEGPPGETKAVGLLGVFPERPPEARRRRGLALRRAIGRGPG